MQDDREFCSRDLAAPRQLLRPIGSDSGFAFADRFISYPQPNASSAAWISHAISMKALDCSGRGPPAHLAAKSPHPAALLLRTSAA